MLKATKFEATRKGNDVDVSQIGEGRPFLRLAGVPLPVVSPARVYVCGITPHDVTHLGHAATFVWVDTLSSVLGLTGADVVTCRNVTDVDDVLTRAASDRGRFVDEFAVIQEFEFERVMRALRVAAPTHSPRASRHVRSVIQLAGALLQQEAAYERNGSVYFRGAGVPDRAGVPRELALALSAEYGDMPDDPLRDDPFDVPVWRPSGNGDPAWPSPWGPGRPGWHAECAAMAFSLLGGLIDLLVGGADLTFPHHAYQAAMVEAVTGAGRFSRARMAVGTVSFAGAKMAKSTGNLVLVTDLLDADVPAAAIRLLLLNRSWGRPWEFHPADLQAAAADLERFYGAAGRTGGSQADIERVRAALLNDLDVPTALQVAQEAGGEAAREVQRTLRLG
jgi:L-cysteine:1D-myo-inositol 2-amino-2-deoxy-alpha-D-glucopyranoside ligase